MTRLVLAASLFVLALTVPAQAQSDRHWGVAGAVVPRWEFMHFLEDAMERDVEVTGRDFTIGVVRGRQLGGEWGVSFVQRRIDDGSVVVQQESLKCVVRAGQPDVCARGTFHVTRNATLTGVQMHRFFALATIKRRVQIGAVIATGLARVRGQAEQVFEHLQARVTSGGAASLGIAAESTVVDAQRIFDETPVGEYVPIGGVEAAVAVLVAPGVKLRVSGGANFPGLHRVAVTAQYLFGSQ